MKHFRSFGGWVLLFCLLSCDSQDSVTPQNTDQEYFPLRKGYYQLYDIDETTYELGVAQARQYQLKVAVIDSFVNGTGVYTYVLQRSIRATSSDPWESAETWSAELRKREVVVTQGSTPFVVLSFPVETGREWNGNSFNTEVNPVSGENEDRYQITETAGNHTINGLSFTDCLTVLQEDNQEFIVYFDQRSEVYARNVGLISKKTTQLKYCNDQDRNCIGQQIIDEGIIYEQTIREYGME